LRYVCSVGLVDWPDWWTGGRLVDWWNLQEHIIDSNTLIMTAKAYLHCLDRSITRSKVQGLSLLYCAYVVCGVAWCAQRARTAVHAVASRPHQHGQSTKI
jgi:hypothetical protein